MEKRVIAKVLGGPDEYTFMYDVLPRGVTCPMCHSWLGCREVNIDFKPSIKKKSCLRCTYDGYFFVSEEFRLFCMENGYQDLEFTPFPKSSGYYSLSPKKIYPLDPFRRPVRFIKLCETCGNYEEVIGISPTFTQPDFILPSNDFIYRTDLEFGTREQKTFLIIIGLETMKKMKSANLRGLFFLDVYR